MRKFLRNRRKGNPISSNVGVCNAIHPNGYHGRFATKQVKRNRWNPRKRTLVGEAADFNRPVVQTDDGIWRHA